MYTMGAASAAGHRESPPTGTVSIPWPPMDFEFGPPKNSANPAKHGIDFTSVQAFLDDPLNVVVPASTVGERWWLVIGRIAERYRSAIITYRQQRVPHHLRQPGPPRGGGDL